jgi:hypothetical protein
MITAVEVGMGTKYIHAASRFSSGVSSNDTCNSEATWLANGGIRFRETGADEWKYAYFYTTANPPRYNASGAKVEWSSMLNMYAPKLQCMEPQMAYSWGQEFGVGEGSRYQFYDGEYWYTEVATGASIGLINARQYKVMSQTFDAYNTSNELTSYDCEVVLREGIGNGMKLAGDFWSYTGGGYEQVGVNVGGASEGAPIHIYLEPDQTQWVRETNVQIAKGNSFSFESKYRYLGEYKTIADNYSRARVSYSNRKTVNGGSMSTYECHYMWSRNAWDTSTAAANLGRKTRAYAVFRGHASHTQCGARSSASIRAVSYTSRILGGSAQFLIE